MDRNRFLDKTIEAAIGLGLAGIAALLSGLRSDITNLNLTMTSLVEKVASHERLFIASDSELRTLRDRVRILEIDCLPRGRLKP